MPFSPMSKPASSTIAASPLDRKLGCHGSDRCRGDSASSYLGSMRLMAGISTCEFGQLWSLWLIHAISSESGVVCPSEHTLGRDAAVIDDFRVDFLTSYADQIAVKIGEGVPIKSYLMWAWTDNFECQSCLATRSSRHADGQGRKDLQPALVSSGSIIRMTASGIQKSRRAS